MGSESGAYLPIAWVVSSGASAGSAGEILP